MKKHMIRIIICAIIAVLGFVLSDTTFESVDSLMRPPKIEGGYSDIQAAFEQSVGDKYKLISPLSGEYKSSFILIDLDNDKADEVVVFYSSSNAVDVARMNVLDNINGSLQSIADLESAHKEIHRVDFSDVDDDGNKEIIVGWSIFDTELLNTLNVYKFKSGENTYIENVFEQKYTDFVVCDVNNDTKTDILLFDKTYHNSLSALKATYYDFSNNKVYEAGDFFVDPIISSIYSVHHEINDLNGNTGFYIDGYKIDSGMTTDLFYWSRDDNAFKRPLYSNIESFTSAATRSTTISCSDINGDNSIEIPFEEYIPESEAVSDTKSTGKQQSIIKWMKYGENGFSTVYYEILNPTFGYSVKIKNEWYGKFTVNNNLNNGLLTFYSLRSGFNYTENERERPGIREEDRRDFLSQGTRPDTEDDKALFSVFATTDDDNERYDLSGYKHIKNDNGYNYYCRIYEEGKKSGITKEAIKKILFT